METAKEETSQEETVAEDRGLEPSPFFWGNPDLVILDDDGAPA